MKRAQYASNYKIVVIPFWFSTGGSNPLSEVP
jgi:hypothetical protein